MDLLESRAYLESTFDPKKLTIAQLSSILSAHGVPLPPSLQRKAVYVELFQKQVQAKAPQILKSLNGIQASSRGIEFIGENVEAANQENNAPISMAKTPGQKEHASRMPDRPTTPLSSRKKIRVSEEGEARVLVPLGSSSNKKRVTTQTPNKPSEELPSKLPLATTTPRRASMRFTKLMGDRPQMSPLPAEGNATREISQEKNAPPSLDRFMISPTLPGIRTKVSAGHLKEEDNVKSQTVPRQLRRTSLIPQTPINTEEPLKVSDLKAFWNKKCREAEEALLAKELPPLPAMDTIETETITHDETGEQQEVMSIQVPSLVYKSLNLSYISFRLLLQVLLVGALISGALYISFFTSLPSETVEVAINLVEQLGKFARENVCLLRLSPVAWYPWLKNWTLDTYEQLRSLQELWTDKETWTMILTRLSQMLKPFLSWFLEIVDEISGYTIPPWILSWDTGLVGLLSLAIGLLLWDSLI